MVSTMSDGWRFEQVGWGHGGTVEPTLGPPGLPLFLQLQPQAHHSPHPEILS
jgi:hypothetical protein